MAARALGSILGLLTVLGGQDPEDDRHTGGETDVLQSTGALAGDEVVVARVTTDDTPEADHGVELAGVDHGHRRERHLERTGHPFDDDVLVGNLTRSEPTHDAVEETLRDHRVETTAHDRDAETRAVEGRCLAAVELLIDTHQLPPSIA